MTRPDSTTHVDDIEVALENTPRGVQIDTWIPACLLLDPPRQSNGKPHPSPEKVWPVVYQLLASTANAHGDARVTVTRSAIAHWAGYSRYDKAAWIVQWLQRIGFLTVYRHYTHGKGGGGRTRDSFTVRLDPPENYRGPTHTGELAAAYADPEAWGSIWTEDPESAGQGQHPLQGVKPEKVLPPTEGKALKTAGQGQNPLWGVKPEKVLPPTEGKALKTAGQGQNPLQGVFPRARRSESDLLSEERRGDQTEPVPGGAAEPPATGKDEHDVAAAEIVEAAPWDRVATRLGSAVSASQLDVDQMTGRIAERLRDGSVTVVQARQVIAAALEEARHKPVAYVAGAFGAGQLSSWRARVSRVVLAQPSTSGEQISADVVDSDSDSLASADAAESLPECEECGTPQGGSVKGRFRRDENGRMVRDAEGHHVPCACVGGPAVWHAA
ncbi:hypothetical protein FHS23_004576 [Prauserella isguenensis]|uniref:Uncharacterized protein n=1 Tax=Prauserella isguenensis TaxID=1470180 RepID=A0A839S812_9PSEU|nr:hypothetical protein [Prauserella isguenensis]MBB3053522.1 hypothetical protein [Prauserella isguenensis]